MPEPEDTTTTDTTADTTSAGATTADDKSTGGDKGYPDNTPLAEMTVEQRAAYWEDRSKKHEGRNKDLLKLTGGKYGDDLKADLEELEQLRSATRTDAERAIAEKERETREQVTREFGARLAAAEFRAALAHVDGERREAIIGGLNLSAYLTDNGDVDTDKVKSYAAAIAPADKGEGSRTPDFGGGRRDTSSGARPGSVAAVQEQRRRAREKQGA